MLVYIYRFNCFWDEALFPKIIFAIFKMCAILQLLRVHKLIGKLGVPYNRRLRVRGSPNPYDYEAGLSLAAAESNAFRIHPDLLCLACRIPPVMSPVTAVRASIVSDSKGKK